MPMMSAVEAAFCRSPAWRYVARRLVLPWVVDDQKLAGQVLEIGAGSGAMAQAVIRAHPDVDLTVTDLDPAMLMAATKRLEQETRVRVEKADATALPFADESFHLVTSYLMMHHVIRWKPVLAEAFRVTRPGGAIAGYDLTDTPLARLVHRLDGSPHRLISPEELDRGLRDVGFKHVSIRVSARGHLMRFRATRPTP